MVHTHNLQGRLSGCGCQGVAAGGKPFRGCQLRCRKPVGSKQAKVKTHCSSTVTNVKLPATHKEASQRALDQLRASSSIVNRKQTAFMHGRIDCSLAACCRPCPSQPAVYCCCDYCMTVLCSLTYHRQLTRWVHHSTAKSSAFNPGYAMEKKSSIIAIGLTIHNTPVDVREKLAIPEVGVSFLLQFSSVACDLTPLAFEFHF